MTLSRSEDGAVPGAIRSALALVAAAAILHLVLVQPNHPSAMTWRALRLFPLELPVVLLTLVALPPGARATTILRRILAALLMAGVLLKVADFATYTALHRAFHPILDLHLIRSAWHLGSGALGTLTMLAAVLGAIALAAGVALAISWALAQFAEVDVPARLRTVAGSLAIVAAVVAAADVAQRLGWSQWGNPPGSAFTAGLAAQRARDYGAAAADLRAFRARAADDAWGDATPLLDRTGGRDVLVIFVESYGASSLRNPLYAPTHRETLGDIQRQLAAQGLAMRSGWLDAPTFGGQSWLSHATLTSGLWVDNQQSYGALLASPRRGLFHLAQSAGFRTAAVMPAITMDWPEAQLMGFDQVLPADALGYRGQPFNWVTMPDQFTLAALDRLVRGADGPPVFAQVALVSSHAPWVPVPELVAWGAIGDGRVYDTWATSGDPPEVVWRDRDRVRAQFRKAIDYSLSTVGAYAALHAADPPLMIVVGDHQPARFVSQEESDAVPIHVIGPPDLVAQIDEWGWTSGLLPDDDAPLWPMDAFRDRFLAAFSSGRPG